MDKFTNRESLNVCNLHHDVFVKHATEFMRRILEVKYSVLTNRCTVFLIGPKQNDQVTVSLVPKSI